jgi:hypothetical protein
VDTHRSVDIAECTISNGNALIDLDITNGKLLARIIRCEYVLLVDGPSYVTMLRYPQMDEYLDLESEDAGRRGSSGETKARIIHPRKWKLTRINA